MIDYSETLNDEQLKNIIQTLFKNFKEIIIKEFPLTKNCESIIVDANINIVFNFWASFQFPYLEDGFFTNLEADGPLNKVGTKINYFYLNKYKVTTIVLEVNGFTQEGNEDDNNEWNYKNKTIFEDGEYEIFNAVFVSCENGSKTYLSLESDINENIELKELEQLSKRKLLILTKMKDFIEKNKEFLTNLLKNQKRKRKIKKIIINYFSFNLHFK